MLHKILAGLTLAALVAASATAAEVQSTTIHIQNMHCANCARKIANKLYAVPAVVNVKTNYQAGIAVVSPQPKKGTSPRALWEAVEKAGFKPVKLEGPSGVFTAKPSA